MASCSSSPRTFLRGEASAAPPPSHPLCPSRWCGHRQKVRGSTAQANLRRIVSIISTVLPPQPHPFNALQSQLLAPPPSLLSPPPLETAGTAESRILSTPSDVQERMLVDLRLRLGLPWEIARRGWPDEEDHDTRLLSSACSVVGEATTKITEGCGGSSSSCGMAPPETAEAGIVSASRGGASGRVVFNSNSSEERSWEGEWNVGGDGGGGAEREKVKKKARAEGGTGGEEERGGGGGDEEREGRPCSEITSHRGNASGGAEENNGITRGGFVKKEDVGAEKVTNGKADGSKESDTGRRCRRGDEGYLGLLLEAVRRVSGGLSGEVEEEPCPPKEENRAEEGTVADEGTVRSKRGRGWETEPAAAFDVYEVVGEEEQTLGPVVRSKRGRSQALPSRYRDSVLESWRKQSGSGRQRRLQRRQARTGR